VKCLDRATLEGLAAERVEGPGREAAHAHVANCPTCSHTLSEIRGPVPSPGEALGDTQTLSFLTPNAPRTPSKRGPLEDGVMAGPAQAAETIGPYTLLEQLGEGGMGAVYTAYDPELDRKVALKLLRSTDEDSESTAQFQARLRREARAMARLDSPNVVAVHDVGRYEDRVYLVMDRVDGSTLKEWLAERPRGWHEVLDAFLQAARGLAAAHAQGLVHRDFKPSNVLVGKDGRVRVTDFGLARRVGPVEAPDRATSLSGDSIPAAELSSSVSRGGSVRGTPRYMAPEQVMAQAVSPWTDQFSFCVALYEALLGEPPFNRPFDSPNPPQLRNVRGNRGRVPRFVRRALMRGLSIAPERRFESMSALVAALSKNPARRVAIVLLSAAVVALIAATAAISVRQSRLSLAGCTDTGHDLAGIWDDEERRAVRASFASADPSSAATKSQAVIQTLDAYAASWTELRGTACARAASLEGDETALFELSCLGREKSDLQTLVGVLAHADAGLATNAGNTVNLLQPPRRCTEGPVLASLPKPPTDPKVRVEVEQLRKALFVARVEAWTGNPKEASHALGPIIDRSRVLHYRPLEAEALAALSYSQGIEGSLVLSQATWVKAEITAEAAGDDELATIAASSLAERASERGRFDDAQQWLDRAESLVERLGGDRMAEGHYEGAVTAVGMQMGKPDEEVLRHAERSYQLLSQVYGPDDVRSWHYLAKLAYIEARAQRYEEADTKLQTALKEIGRMAGEATLLTYLGQAIVTSVYSGHVDEAEQSLAVGNKLSALYPDQANVWIAAIFFGEAILRDQQARPDEAIAAARQAQAMTLQTAGADSTLYRQCLWIEGDALNLEHRYGEARSVLGRALEAFDKYETPDADGPVEALRSMAVAEIGLGHPLEAIPLVERALALEGGHHAFSGQLAALRFTLARALVASKGDAERARDLAERARSELAAIPWRQGLLEEVTSWMRANEMGHRTAPE
jgi:serine/threonine protein kinase/tetratricopeptide (TPR) repeat protein